MKHIFLYGPPGSGKSTVGKILARNLDLPFLDLDAEIEREAGRSIPQIMAEDGEAAFRDLEAAALERAVNAPPMVIALGGGALLREQNRIRAEANGDVVFLEASLETLLTRLRADKNQRPLLAGDLEAKLRALLERRAAHYASFDLRVANNTNNDNNNDSNPEDVARQIQYLLGRFRVRGMGQGYEVWARSQSLMNLAAYLRAQNLEGPLALVSDSHVAPLYADSLGVALRQEGYEVALVTFPAGEEHKTLETIKALWQGFLEAGLDRRSTVLALGGGVVGDLAGFAAATFMRGVPWVCLPTSLLAMVDASLGGKTGFDLPQGKNLIGAFHPPRLVLADVTALSTLPEVELRGGLAEVVKHGVIGDPYLFDLCRAGYESVRASLLEIVRRAMRVKIQIIEADPFERGERAALNLGHTVGHALEAVSGYRLRHGEAVAIGMVAEARLAERLGLAASGLADCLADTLRGLGLPVEIPAAFSRQAILDAIRYDKKRRAGVVRFALPLAVGKVQVGVPVEDLTLIF